MHPNAAYSLAVALFAVAQLVVTLFVPETAPLPLCAIEVRALLRQARRMWAGAQTDAAASDVALPLKMADSIFAALLKQWRPNSQLLFDADAEIILKAWRLRMKQEAAGSLHQPASWCRADRSTCIVSREPLRWRAAGVVD